MGTHTVIGALDSATLAHAASPSNETAYAVDQLEHALAACERYGVDVDVSIQYAVVELTTRLTELRSVGRSEDRLADLVTAIAILEGLQ